VSRAVVAYVGVFMRQQKTAQFPARFFGEVLDL
jgi:hypothetical protein